MESEEQSIELAELIKRIRIFESHIEPSSKGYKILKNISSGNYDFELDRLGKVVEHLKDHSEHYMKQVSVIKKETLQLRLWIYTRVLIWE